MPFHRQLRLGILLSLLALVFIAANAEPKGRIFWHLLTAYDGPAAAILGVLLLGGLVAELKWRRPDAWVGQLVRALDRYAHAVAAIVWVGLAYATVHIYRNHPLSMDEYAAYFQAQVFAGGALHGTFPPELLDRLVPRGFQNHFLMVNRATGAVFSAYWPGFSLLLAPFMAAGIPWACNPLLVALSLLMIRRLARDVIPWADASGWAMLLALASPVFLVTGITYYSMPAHLLFNILYAWLLLSPTPRRLFLAGLVGGFALVLHNPFPHLVFAAPWLLWLALRRDRDLLSLAWIGLGYLPMVLCFGLGWLLWQQQVLQAGTTAAGAALAVAGHNGEAGLAMMERIWRVVSGLFRFLHSPNEDVMYARLGGLVKLWLWASPLLLLLAWQGGRERKEAVYRLLGSSALLTFFAYFAIPFDQGHGWGYRYFHSAWGVLPVLAAAGIHRLQLASRPTGGGALAPLAGMTIVGLLMMNVLRFQQVGEFMQEHLAQMPPAAVGGRAFVFHNLGGYYGADLVQNDPWLRGGRIILADPTASAEKEVVEKLALRPQAVMRNRFGVTYITEP